MCAGNLMAQQLMERALVEQAGQRIEVGELLRHGELGAGA